MKIDVNVVEELRKEGYNCCQAIVCSLNDLDFNKEDLFKISEGFGLGMGVMDLACGAVSAITMVVGISNSKGSDFPQNKKDTYQKINSLLGKFKSEFGSLNCKDLKDNNVPCSKCISRAADLINIHLGGNNNGV